ncbi:hypothetical protein K438DRAFT_1602238 [Mycena galopus ATCC 62051]|nr:hypothetical protein K438DRAFT_1602238 [Mycena galopus ATCC 62051]
MAAFQPSDFTNYSSPYPSTPCSATYFGEITFEQAAEPVFPTICSSNAISAWTFTDEIPSDADSIVQPNESIPHINDILPIQRDVEQKYSEGARSVAVTLKVAGGTVANLYHLSKVNNLFLFELTF